MNNLQKTKQEIMEEFDKACIGIEITGGEWERIEKAFESSLNRIIQSIKESLPPEESSNEDCIQCYYLRGRNQYRQEVLDILEKGKE